MNVSPYSLLQEEFRRDKPHNWEWRMLVTCVLLNQTSAKQVRPVLEPLFQKWPDPLAMSMANPEKLEQLIRPCGLATRRTRTLIKMSEDYLHGDPIENIFGVGKYALDSWKIFVSNEKLDIDYVHDKELKNYLRWLHEDRNRWQP